MDFKTRQKNERKLGNGRFLDLSDEDYAKDRGLRRTELLDFDRSEAHFMQGPYRPKTPDLEFGQDFHLFSLQPDVFEDNYIFLPEDFRGKSLTTNEKIENGSNIGGVKKAYVEFKKEHQNKKILKAEVKDQLTSMRTNMLKHDGTNSLFKNAIAHEATCYHNIVDDLDGKSRIDVDTVAKSGWPILVDIKTTTDASKEAVSRSVFNYAYFRQAAYYIDSYEKVTGEKVGGFVFVFVEKSKPYNCQPYQMEREYIEYGKKLNDLSVDSIVKWLRHGTVKPYYDEKIPVVSMPHWVKNEEDR
tara:strand:- start:82 stop:981 length:900 start_codon:yes stop_codon:yes gene_type:complete